MRLPHYANGNVQAITQDDAKLVGLLANLPEKIKADFGNIAPLVLQREYQAVAAAKGEQRLINEINNTLLRLEKEGKADEIYNRWFGPDTKSAQPRGDF